MYRVARGDRGFLFLCMHRGYTWAVRTFSEFRKEKHRKDRKGTAIAARAHRPQSRAPEESRNIARN